MLTAGLGGWSKDKVSTAAASSSSSPHFVGGNTGKQVSRAVVLFEWFYMICGSYKTHNTKSKQQIQLVPGRVPLAMAFPDLRSERNQPCAVLDDIGQLRHFLTAAVEVEVEAFLRSRRRANAWGPICRTLTRIRSANTELFAEVKESMRCLVSDAVTSECAAIRASGSVAAVVAAARLDVVDAVLRKFDKAVENHAQCERGVFETQERH